MTTWNGRLVVEREKVNGRLFSSSVCLKRPIRRPNQGYLRGPSTKTQCISHHKVLQNRNNKRTTFMILLFRLLTITHTNYRRLDQVFESGIPRKKMGKVTNVGQLERDSRQKIATPDATECDCCTPVEDVFAIHKKQKKQQQPEQQQPKTFERKELVIIGAGPHALTLLLRLLEPDADLSSDKERHTKADFLNRMRPLAHVRKHIKNLFKGPAAVYKKSKKKADAKGLTLDYVKENVMVVDGSLLSSTTSSIHGWMAGWKKNFETLNIEQLRSPISAHADPFDHRSLEFFAVQTNREDELIPLEHLEKQTGRWDFHGPYNAPSTRLFHDFHTQLITGYGVQDIPTPGNVEIIRCDTISGEFEVYIRNPNTAQTTTVKTLRVVCAVGPAYRKVEPLLSRMVSLDPMQQILQTKVLRGNQIIDFLSKYPNSSSTELPLDDNQSILIVGGGVTSAHLALTVADRGKYPWCKSVVLIQRSKMKERQFDLDTAWMGPARGKRLENFWNHSHQGRAAKLREERGGGSIHPEVVRMVQNKAGGRTKLSVKEETEIMDVQYDHKRDKLLVSMDDGLSSKAFDMIWLATGFENHVDNYPFLDDIREELPVDTVQGLPVLNKDLSWKSSNGSGNDGVNNEAPNWQAKARNRFWMLGPLAGLELGPDALNLMGARQGAVRVAKAIRADICCDSN